jgi:glycosyltransferase involved in cell wall biosynthesis
MTTGIQPELSLVMPAFNEEDIVEYTIRRLVKAFRREDRHLQLIAVDNGSTDRTGEIIRAAAAEFPNVAHLRVEQNRGYGFGVLSGMRLATGAWVGFIPADSQVDAEDVVRLFESARAMRGPVVAKVRRRFRMDGLHRRLVTAGYNTLLQLFWPNLPSWDVNAVPKLVPREMLDTLQLRSDRFELDAELMIKAHYLGARVFEFNILSRERENGVSHVRFQTSLDLFLALVRFRFSSELSAWRRSVQAHKPAAASAPRIAGP